MNQRPHCRKCGEVKPRKGFHPGRKTCKECVREAKRKWCAANSDYLRDYRHKWYVANLARHRESNRKWIAANPERRREIAREFNRKQRAVNPERAREKLRKWRASDPSRMRKYNRQPEPTRPMPEGCECCGRSSTKKALNLDHCHVSGVFRGWLCSQCNTAIGLLGDNLNGAKRAVRYLERA
jgi:hypothetical protein